MSTRLYLHVLDGCTEGDIATYFGWCNNLIPQIGPVEIILDRVQATPHCYYAATLAAKRDHAAPLPTPYDFLMDVIGDKLPILHARLLATILGGLSFPVREDGEGAANPDEVLTFLLPHMGKRLFFVVD